MEIKYFGEFRDVYSKAAGDVYSKAVSEMYSKAVSEMYSQFKQKEAHPLEKYIGRLVNFYGEKLEVVGYSRHEWMIKHLRIEEPVLIVDASRCGGWTYLEPWDVIFKKCGGYLYVSINNLIE